MGTDNKKLSTCEFISKVIQTHGDKYDYSKVDYKNNTTKITIICKIHGEFEQAPKCHAAGYNCPMCSKHMHVDGSEFKKRAADVHNNRYDYSKVDYKNTRTKVDIFCQIHGKFSQRPENHMAGQGCPKCGRISQISKSLCDSDRFIKKAMNIHGNKYDYSGIEYKGAKTKIKIACNNGHEFHQVPNTHLSNHGCPFCTHSVSSGHEELVNFIKEDKTVNDRKAFKEFEVDIFVKNKNLAIEYHGLYWHSDEFKNRMYHYNKASVCFDNGVQLVQVFENEWLLKKDIVKSVINSKLGINTKIFARKCEMKILSNDEFNVFCNENHMQGKLDSTIKLGLVNNSVIVCAIGFNKHKKYNYECTRFCNKLNINVVGGASKLFSFFLRQYCPKTVLSYADRRYSNGNLYKKLGFELDSITNPDYFYFKNGNIHVFSRQSFQKHKLKSKLNVFDNTLTEYENMINNGYKRIWGAGHWKYIYDASKIK